MERALDLFVCQPLFFLGFLQSDISGFHIPSLILTRRMSKHHSRVLITSLTRPLDCPVDCRTGNCVVAIQAKSHVSINIRTHVTYDDNSEGAGNIWRIGNVRNRDEEKIENENYPGR